ncbi:MAG: hypothetical protein IT457_07565 [Planctomycetes bacterium]|nr:hypothetical protein [Planctomycetota bacterium]
MTTIHPRAAHACVALFLFAAGHAQTPKPAEPEPAQEPKASWPELPAKENERVLTQIRKLETGNEADSAKAQATLVAYGPALVPHLLRRLALPRQSDDAIAAVTRTLDAIVTDEHAPLVAKATEERALPTQRWALRWLTLHADERWREVYARHAGGAATDGGKPAAARDEELVFCADLALAALQDKEALARVIEVCHTQWRERGEFVGAVLPKARGREMASWVIRQMRPNDERSRVTGLRLLRSLATPEYAAAIANYLDSGESSVKREAINALRAVVDGAPPIEELSVFSAIEQAKQWKERLK